MAIVTKSGRDRQAVVRLTANDTIVVAGNSSTSNVASTLETVESASIVGVYWASDATWTIKRGANTILVLPGYGQWDLREKGVSLSEFAAANVVANTTTANASLVLILSKKGTQLDGS